MKQAAAKSLPIAVLATRPDIVGRATRTAMVVGTILLAINHGPAILSGDIDLKQAIQIALTYCVPYGVTTYASVQAVRAERAKAIPSE